MCNIFRSGHFFLLFYLMFCVSCPLYQSTGFDWILFWKGLKPVRRHFGRHDSKNWVVEGNICVLSSARNSTAFDWTCELSSDSDKPFFKVHEILKTTRNTFVCILILMSAASICDELCNIVGCTWSISDAVSFRTCKSLEVYQQVCSFSRTVEWSITSGSLKTLL